jgi:hypothetical protein
MSNFKTAQLLVEEKKVTRYLLNTYHPDGGSKARFFTDHGFTLSEWEIFAQALRNHAKDHPVKSIEETLFGTKYVIEGVIYSPEDKKFLIRTVWIVKIKEQHPILITAYPIQ